MGLIELGGWQCPLCGEGGKKKYRSEHWPHTEFFACECVGPDKIVGLDVYGGMKGTMLDVMSSWRVGAENQVDETLAPKK